MFFIIRATETKLVTRQWIAIIGHICLKTMPYRNSFPRGLTIELKNSCKNILFGLFSFFMLFCRNSFHSSTVSSFRFLCHCNSFNALSCSSEYKLGFNVRSLGMNRALGWSGLISSGGAHSWCHPTDDLHNQKVKPSLFIKLNFCNKISEHGIRNPVGVSTYVSGSRYELTDRLFLSQVHTMHLASGFRIGNFLSVIPSVGHTFQSEIGNKLVWRVIVLNVTFP